MPLSASDVANKQFTTVKLREGYNMEEVDGFLDEVEGELGRLHREIDDLTAKATALAAAPPPPIESAPAVAPVPVPVAPAPAPTDAAVRMLELAQKTADEHVAGAKAEAAVILAEAKATHDRAMGALESERSAVQAKVDELRAFEKEYRTRLRSYLEGQLRDLDAKAAAPAAAAGSAGPPAPAASQYPAPAAPVSAAPVSAAPPAQVPPLQSAPPLTPPVTGQPPRPFSPTPAPDAPSGPPVQAD